MSTNNVLNDEITWIEPVNSDKNFMHQGQERTFVLDNVMKVEKVVVRFSEQLPAFGICWHAYDTLAPDEKKLVDTLEPDKRKNGDPKSKFATLYQLEFKDSVTGRQFLFDVKFYTNTDGSVWPAFKDFLEMLGPEIKGPVKLGDYLKIGQKFTATLVKRNDGYLHIDQQTLQPIFEIDTEQEKPVTISETEAKLLEYLQTDGTGTPLYDIPECLPKELGNEDELLKAWNNIKKRVKSYTNDGVTVNITL